jgi:biotin synthase
MLSLCRIMLPEVLLPATTALGTLQADGREQGILAGANVIMPNLTPQDVQKNYNLYNNKIHADKNIADAIEDLQKMLLRIGYTIKIDRGDHRRKIC